MVFCIKIWWLIPCIDHVLYICTPPPIMNLLLNCTIMWLASPASLAKCKRKIYIFSFLFFSQARMHESTTSTKLEQMLSKIILFKLASGYHMNCTRVRSFVLLPIVCVLFFFFLFPIFFFRFVSLVSLLRVHRFLYEKPMATNKDQKKKRKKETKEQWSLEKMEKKIYREIQCGNNKWRMTNDERWMANGEQQKPQ